MGKGLGGQQLCPEHHAIALLRQPQTSSSLSCVQLPRAGEAQPCPQDGTIWGAPTWEVETIGLKYINGKSIFSSKDFGKENCTVQECWII